MSSSEDRIATRPPLVDPGCERLLTPDLAPVPTIEVSRVAAYMRVYWFRVLRSRITNAGPAWTRCGRQCADGAAFARPSARTDSIPRICERSQQRSASGCGSSSPPATISWQARFSEPFSEATVTVV